MTCLENGSGQFVQRSVAFPQEFRTLRRVQVTVDELRPATGYGVTVRALNRLGAGPDSEAISLVTPEAVPSSSPVNLQCISVSADAIQVTWAHPDQAHHHGHLQGFRIFYKILPNSAKRIFAADDVASFRPESKRVGNVLDTTLYGLQAFQNYSVQISALNRAGTGPLSAPVICQTDEKGIKSLMNRCRLINGNLINDILLFPIVPNAVQELKAASVSSSSIVVVWRRPTPPSGRIGYYVIFVKDTVTQEIVSTTFLNIIIYVILKSD